MDCEVQVDHEAAQPNQPVSSETSGGLGDDTGAAFDNSDSQDEEWVDSAAQLNVESCPVCKGKGIVEGFLYGHSQCIPCEGTGQVEVGGWLTVTHERDPEFHMQSRFHDGQTFVRSTVEVPLCMNDALICFADITPEKVAWSPHFQNVRIDKVLECSGKLPNGMPEDKICTMEVNIPWFLKPFNFASSYCVRAEYTVGDQRAVARTSTQKRASLVAHLQSSVVEGEVSCSIREWDHEKNDYVVGGHEKYAVIRPHLTDQDKCFILGFQKMPAWAPIATVLPLLSGYAKSSLESETQKFLKHRAKVEKRLQAENAGEEFDTEDVDEYMVTYEAGEEDVPLGLTFHAAPPGYLEVTDVKTGTFADRVGFTVGGLVIEVNGFDLEGMSKDSFKAFMSRRPLRILFKPMIPKFCGASESW